MRLVEGRVSLWGLRREFGVGDTRLHQTGLALGSFGKHR